jgi:hypothetical protein
MFFDGAPARRDVQRAATTDQIGIDHFLRRIANEE